MRLWQIQANEEIHDMAISELGFSTQPSRPPSTRTAISFAYISQFLGLTLNNYISIGGTHSNGSLSSGTMGSYVTRRPDSLFSSFDSGSFPSFPNEVAGAVIASDTTVLLQFDADGYANASVYVFGGENSTHLSSTMYVSYSPPNQTKPTEWIVVEPESEAVPAPRMDAASVQKDGFWYIFGGRNSTGSFGDMWQFEFKTRKWTLLADSGYVATPATGSPASSPETRGKPSPRYGHAMTLMKPGSSNLMSIASEFILLAGGTNGETYYGDAWVFDLTKKTFSQIHITDRPYEARAWLGLFADSSKPRVFVYGGNNKQDTLFSDVYMLDLESPASASSRLSPSSSFSTYLLIIALLALLSFV